VFAGVNDAVATYSNFSETIQSVIESLSLPD
jgi:hypothetical protein